MVSAAAAQLGILGACVVLFVPMGLAGLHLSRNKMLFFSGALFISLAVLVHLAPYLPSLFAAGPTAPPLPLSCLRLLPSSVLFLRSPPAASSFTFRSATATCRFRKISRRDALDLLNGTWILAAGDSQSRLLILALLRLLLADPAALDSARSDLFRRHSDYQIQIAASSIALDFVWSPFESNISSALRSLSDRAHPDVIIAGSGLWHMLHVTNSTDYGCNLREIKETARKDDIFTSSHVFWMGLPALVERKLNTEEKRGRMNWTMQERYNAEVDRSGILRRNGGPFSLLDVGVLSRRCGPQCTADGMHYDEVVYDAAVQVLLNALLIETQQRV